MQANSRCIPCILSKEEKRIRKFPDETKKSEYLHQILELLYRKGQTESAPWLVEQINGLYRKFWGEEADYSAQKQRYNRLLLEMEPQIEARICQTDDVLRECIKYVCAANYIDFSAVSDVNEHMFGKLIEKAALETIDEKEYAAFLQDLRQADTLAYLTDNCGEIVLDIFLCKCELFVDRFGLKQFASVFAKEERIYGSV